MAALDAIANGAPRWIETELGIFGQGIHPQTGLPIASLGSPPELAERNEAFARGYNDSILAGIEAGEIDVDFRPLLMSLDEIVQAFATHRLGVLALDSPRIEEPNGRFVLYVQAPKKPHPNKRPRRSSVPATWIVFENAAGLRDDRFSLYEGPLEIATGRDGRVVLFKTDCLFIAKDVATTQVLQCFLRR